MAYLLDRFEAYSPQAGLKLNRQRIKSTFCNVPTVFILSSHALEAPVPTSTCKRSYPGQRKKGSYLEPYLKTLAAGLGGIL
jgi:hypothetical protein